MGVDGRLAKGRRRRRELLDATLRVIGRAGVAGVSQRVVATEAGVPASAVTYYFPTVDDLLLAVFTDVNDDYLAALERCADDPDPLAALSRLVAGAGDPLRRPATAAEFELFVLAGRAERWRREYQRWTDALEAFGERHGTGGAHSPTMAALVDGLMIRSYCHPAPPTPDDVHAALRSPARTRPDG